MNVQTYSKKNWLKWSWEREISLEGEISTAQASALVHLVFQKILPRSLFHEKAIANYKGRDAGQLLLKLPSKAEKPLQNEIVSWSGTSGRTGEPERYGLSISSPFLAFRQGAILHEVRETRSLSLPRSVPAHLLGYISPLQVESFRLGIERFRPSRSPLSFGSTPEVQERLHLDYTEGHLRAEISAEGLRAPGELPFSATGELRELLDFFKVTEHSFGK
ncbi:hypothetical protein MRY87_00160 [bacterium]|nr:hypothetical protein [bacterium]